MSAPTVYDVPGPGIRWRLPHQCALLYRNDREFVKFQFVAPQNDTERVRVGTITDHARHDLAVGPADKFQFVDLVFLFYHVISCLSTVFPVAARKIRNVPAVGGVRLLGKAIQVI